MTFAERLFNLMQRDGITNYRLSKLVGCSPTTVANWLSGKEVTPAYLQQLADTFKVTTDFLLGGNENAPIQKDERIEEPEIRAIQRAAKNMTQGDRKRMLSMLQLAFEEAFKDDGGDEP